MVQGPERWIPDGQREYVLLLLVLGVGSTIMGAVIMDHPGGGDRPNVIVVSAPTLRAQALGTYGARGNTTPNIDAFAADSTVFTQAAAQAPWTFLSATSWMTSQYLSVSGVTGYSDNRTSQQGFMAERMSSLGYRTVGSFEAKDGRGQHLYREGFDSFSSGEELDISTMVDAALNQTPRLADDGPLYLRLMAKTTHEPYARGVPEEIRQEVIDPYDGPLQYYRSMSFSNKPLGGLLSRIRERNGTFVLTEKFNGETISEATLNRRLRSGWRDSHIMERLEPIDEDTYRIVSRGHPLQLNMTDIRYIRQHYQADVRYLDIQFGRLLEGLREQGLYEDSIIVLMSPHGTNLGEHLVGEGTISDHLAPYEHTVRVPLIIRAPGYDSRTITEEVELLDLQPTLLDLAGDGGRDWPRMQGTSLQPLMNGEDMELGYQFIFKGGVRNRSWKLIDRPAGTELYHLRTDPREQHNVADEHPRIVEALRDARDRQEVRNTRFRQQLE